MTRVGKFVQDVAAAGRLRRHSAPAAPPSTKPTGRELVPVTAAQPPREDGHKSSQRGSASFLAQLIANDSQLPQTRERRRAEPQVALAAYGTAAGLMRR